MEHWREIYSFPEYSVSDYGRVRNNLSGHIMTMLRNQQGVTHVGLTKNRTQHKRSVAVLVASAYLPEPPDETFDTPINLDGDRSNNRAVNLTWRPRWFAVKYFRQFKEDWYKNEAYFTPIEDVDTHQTFGSAWEAAIMYGLLVHDIFMSTLRNTRVWPTQQKFQSIKEIRHADTGSRYWGQILGADITSR